jgi:folate-binding protein YgfZ
MPDISAEYLIIQNAAGWADRNERGRLQFEGRDAAGFLQGLVTNDVAALRLGAGTYAALLTPQGRMVADFRLYHRGDRLVAEVAPGTATELAARLDGLIFAEDLRVTDISNDTAVVSVVGARAVELAGRALGVEPEALAALAPLAQSDAGTDVFVVRSDEAEWPMFDVWMPAEERDGLVARLEQAGIEQVSTDVFDVLRVEAARPTFGVDMTTDTIPLEAGLLERAISTTKGCYVGQEVIIRVLHRGGGRVAKRLVQIAFDAAETGVEAGQKITEAPESADATPARDVGRITSVAFSPKVDRMLALGYVARDRAEVGTRVIVETAAGSVTGEILKLAG